MDTPRNRLNPMFAFEGIGASIFTGKTINEHKIWCNWVLSTSPRKIPGTVHSFLKLSDYVPNDRISKNIRWIVNAVFNTDYGIETTIPSDLVPFFDVSQKKHFTEPRAVATIDTLFDKLRDNGISYFEIGLYDSLSDDINTQKFVSAFDLSYDFYFIKLSKLDAFGHQYGPNSSQIKTCLTKIDSQVRFICEHIKSLFPEYNIVIFSDHGMTEVKHHIDLISFLRRLPIKHGHDYILFLDSTIARFWFFNLRAYYLIKKGLTHCGFGKILTADDLIHFDIHNVGGEYGSLFFALHEGYVFFPDYFRKSNPPLGMHGYAWSTDDPIFIRDTNSRKLLMPRSLYMYDICSILLSQFGL